MIPEFSEKSAAYVNSAVIHKKWGEGSIKSICDNKITVEFSVGEKVFVWPDAFENFLVFKDEEKQKNVIKQIESTKEANTQVLDKTVNNTDKTKIHTVPTNKTFSKNLISNSWLIPCNIGDYDIFSAFSNLETIDWRQSSKVQNGDTVYIYCGKPCQKIMYKTTVIAHDISPLNVDKSDEKYNKTPEFIEDLTPRFGFMRLALVKYLDKQELSLNRLLANGLKTAPQGPCRLNGLLLEYIDSYFD